MKGPRNVRRRVACDIVEIERQTSTILRGYVRRASTGRPGHRTDYRERFR